MASSAILKWPTKPLPADRPPFFPAECRPGKGEVDGIPNYGVLSRGVSRGFKAERALDGKPGRKVRLRSGCSVSGWMDIRCCDATGA